MELRDFRYAFRSLRKSPGFVAVAVLSLGLGLGLVTTMFALLDAVTHPFVPYRDADRLCQVSWRWHPSLHIDAFDVYRQVRDRTHSFESILPVVGSLGASLDSAGNQYGVRAAMVSSRFFSVLGVRTRLGRTLTDADAGRHVAVVSDPLWRKVFGDRHSLEGASVTFGHDPYTVVGVMPRGMTFPYDAGVWVAMSDAAERTGAGLGNFSALVKLKRGVSAAQADTDLAALARQLTVRYHAAGAPFYLVLLPVRDDPMHLGDVHYAMLGASLAVLLIACANLANLMLARGLSKRREVALRLAVGASRAAVVWQMFAESALLTVGGAAAGLVLSLWGAGVLAHRMPQQVWYLGLVEPQLSWRVFVLSALAAGAAAIVFGLIPAARVANAVSLDEPLKDGAGTTGRVRHRYSALAISEVGLALALLMGAGLLLKVVHRLRTYDYNFPARQLLQGWVGSPGVDSATPRERLSFYLSTVSGLKSVAGIADAAAAVGRWVPGGAVTAELTADTNRIVSMLSYPAVTPGYLRAMGLPVLEGRDFADGDLAGDGAVILNTVAAARLYSKQNPVGHMVKLGGAASSAPWVHIVGVCRTALRPQGWGDLTTVEAAPEIYVVRGASLGGRGRGAGGTARLIIRVYGDPTKAAVSVTRALRSLVPHGNLGVYPYLYSYDAVLQSRNFLAQLFASMGSFALALAAIGIYGVLACAVNRRVREFGVRIALGAQRSDLLKSVLHDGLVMTLAGTGLGAFVALWSSYLLENLLEDVYPTDALTLVVAEAVLIAVTIVACLAPAFRAMRADPIEILRAT
jgi:putative ABC transport system permease protein